MKKFILIIGMLLMPITSFADCFTAINKTTLNFGNTKVKNKAEQYFGSSSASGASISFGCRPKSGWGVTAGYNRVDMNSKYPTPDLIDEFDLPLTTIINIRNINGYGSVTEIYVDDTPPTGSEDIDFVFDGDEGTITGAEIDAVLSDIHSGLESISDGGVIVVDSETAPTSLEYEVDLSPLYDATNANVKLESESYYVDFIRYWQPSKNVSLYAGFGIMEFSLKLSASIDIGDFISIRDSRKDSIASIRLIIGGSYFITDNVAFSYQREHITDRDAYHSVGISYFF